MPMMNLTEKRNKKKQFINKQELQNAVEGRTAHTQIAQPGSSRFEPLAQISSPAACSGSHAPCSRRARAGHATAARGCSRPHEPAALGAACLRRSPSLPLGPATRAPLVGCAPSCARGRPPPLLAAAAATRRDFCVGGKEAANQGWVGWWWGTWGLMGVWVWVVCGSAGQARGVERFAGRARGLGWVGCWV